MCQPTEFKHLEVHITETNMKHLTEVLRFIAELIEKGEMKDHLIYKDYEDTKNYRQFGAYDFSLRIKTGE